MFLSVQAAIINYYHMDSTLSPHTDHSEFDLDSPLISVSFGQSAIFLVGGTSREDEAIGMYLRSGDIAIMMGPSRLAFHAVPRVLRCEQPYFSNCFKHESLEDKFTRDSGPISEISRKTDDVTDIKSFSKSRDASVLSKENLQDLETRMQATLKFLSEDNNWEAFEKYLANNRLNMNIRQVNKASS